MTAKTSFGQWLRQRRKALDITQEDLAGRVGCAASTLYKIEADERRPSRQIAELLAEHLNIPPDKRPAFIQFARAETAGASVGWDTPFHSPTNLQTQPTLLIGRETDVAAIRKRLLQSEVRLLTLTGAPGIGKTRLALQVATEALDDFTDGVFFIALAPISDANLVPTTIANTLGVPEIGPRTPLERLQVFLRNKQILLLLDNFEQILLAAPQIAELLSVCPSLKMLVTSRAPLRIRQERQFPVAPLALPDLIHHPDAETVTHYSAVTLFVERAQAVKPNFSLTPENAPTVASICVRLDGLPLAIELISARVKLLSPSALLERLGGRLILHSDGLRDIEPRHRTLNAAIEWSYELLNVEEQTLFRRSSVFVGGWTLDAAGAICMENLSLNLLDGMASLLDKNLIKEEAKSEGEPRFIMLQTIHEYALQQATANDELESLRNLHAHYFTALAERTDQELFRTDPIRWRDILDAELDNFRAALTWGENGLRLAVALHEFWMRRGHLSEGNTRLADALTQHKVGLSSSPQVDENRRLRAKALDWLATIGVWQGDLDSPESRYDESLNLYRELGDNNGIGTVLGHLSTLFQMRGDYERAILFSEECLALFRKIGNSGGSAWALILVGAPNYMLGNTQRAGEIWEESLILFRNADVYWGVASVLVHLAIVALDQGDYSRANDHLKESLIRFRKLGERWQIIHNLEVFARMWAAVPREAGEYRQLHLLRSARLFGAAEALREIFGTSLVPFRRQSYDQGIDVLKAQLNNAALTAAWAEGRAMTLDQAVDYALAAT